MSLAETTMPPFMVTLADGREVPASSREWLAECQARDRHVDTLMPLRGPGMVVARRQYLADVAAAEGAESARRLQERFTAVWQRNQATA